MKGQFRHWWKEENPLFTIDGNTHTTKARRLVARVVRNPKTGQAQDFQCDGRAVWNLGQERAALAYELARRVNRRKALPPWPDLCREEVWFLPSVVGSPETEFIERT